MVIENIVIFIVILRFSQFLLEIDKRYIKKLNYSLSYILGNLLIIIYFSGWLYFNIIRVKSYFIAEYLLLCLIGISLYCRGMSYLELYKGKDKTIFNLLYKISLLITAIFLITVGVLL